MLNKLFQELASQELLIVQAARQKLIEEGTAIVPDLLALLSSANAKQISNLAIVLGEIRDFRAIAPLLQCLKTNENLMVRSTIARALGNFQQASLALALHELLASEDEMVTVWLLDSLARIGAEASLPVLLNYLPQVESPSLRVSVLRAIGSFLGRGQDSLIQSSIAPYAQDLNRHVCYEVDQINEKLENLRSSIV